MQDFADAILRDARSGRAPDRGDGRLWYGAAPWPQDPSDANLDAGLDAVLAETRPTAINLRWALDRCKAPLLPLPEGDRAAAALQLAHRDC